jgi:hypothetical protein
MNSNYSDYYWKTNIQLRKQKYKNNISILIRHSYITLLHSTVLHNNQNLVKATLLRNSAKTAFYIFSMKGMKTWTEIGITREKHSVRNNQFSIYNRNKIENCILLLYEVNFNRHKRLKSWEQSNCSQNCLTIK